MPKSAQALAKEAKMAVSKRLQYEILQPRDTARDDIEWRPIPGFSGMYQASTDGRVRSVNRSVVRTDQRTRRLVGRVLKQQIDSTTGYPKVALYRDGRPTHRYVHALIAETYLGPRPDGMEVAHGDGDKTNASLANLRYATPPENQADRVRHGTSNRGIRNAYAVLDDEAVLEIDRLLNRGRRQRDIAERFGVARTTISAISTGRAWGHLTGRGEI